MVTFVAFFAGFYLGIFVFSLLTASRKYEENDQSLPQFQVIHPLHKTDER
ncbi:MAG TPA: hypothetical protein VMT62_03975 [Syntrophorhabdaceae bacterium]|nr:hypothetical protein [Syntrophorhabdaceae bacterium]